MYHDIYNHVYVFFIEIATEQYKPAYKHAKFVSSHWKPQKGSGLTVFPALTSQLTLVEAEDDLYSSLINSAFWDSP